MPIESHLLDLNVLVALAWPQHVHHRRAHTCFAARRGDWMTSPVTESGFVRLSTNPTVVTERISMADALAPLERIVEDFARVYPRSLTQPTSADFQADVERETK